jgi:hypothetical protein
MPEVTTSRASLGAAPFGGLWAIAPTVTMPTTEAVEPPLPSEVVEGALRRAQIGTLSIKVTSPWTRAPAATGGDPLLDHYVPHTEIGRRLLAVRRAYLAAGGRPLDIKEIRAEIQQFRGE